MTSKETFEANKQARTAYDLLELYIPWEHLSPRAQQGFQAIAEYFMNDPQCLQCGADLLCLDCDAEPVSQEAICPTCQKSLICPNCERTNA
jgi:hypothetical protein